MSTKTDKRAKEILRLLLTQAKVSVEDLAEKFATSPASIRRDLIRLEALGLVHRTHGGAMMAGQTYEPFRFDASFDIREVRFSKEKRRIALAASQLIKPNETIGFTAGTTTTEIARTLLSRKDLHVVTNAVNIGLELSSKNGCDVLLTGGQLRWPGAFSLIGPSATESLSSVVMDKVFVGVCGIDPKYGATTIQAEEAAVFRSMCRHAKQVIVVADSSKIGMMSPSVICSANEISTLITDDGISADQTQSLDRARIQVIVA